MKNILLASTVVAALVSASPVISDDQKVSGNARVIDGDTIEIGWTHYRLSGIDAPETRQQCHIDGTPYECGIEAKAALIKIVSGRVVTCHKKGFNAARGNFKSRIVAQCFVDADRTDLSRAMVLSGHAIQSSYAKGIYADAQRIAFKSGVGLWRGSFQEPWRWREANASN